MNNVFESQRSYFMSDSTKSYDFRKMQLQKLYNAILMYEEAIIKALFEDLHKSSFEAYTTEIGFCLHSIKNTLKNLKKWMRTQKVKTPFYHFPMKSFLRYEPLGQVLIIGPYNYPFHLVIEPLIGAIAAGNTVFIKPSEHAKATSKVLAAMIEETYDPNYIFLVNGDKVITQELLNFPFDHIFFTGSSLVGKKIYQAAANNLIPVTLELGGKSPVIIDKTANLDIAANRIVFGKFINAGQTCIAPDFIYIEESVKDKFIIKLKTTISKFYPDLKNTFGRIISNHHFKRLFELVDPTKVVYGYEFNEEENFLSPTIIDHVSFDDPIMQEEIFGPLLPILTFTHIDEAITRLKTMEKPLALYLFTENKSVEEKIIDSLSFGGGAINDTVLHVANLNLPFGGVGHSGMGVYHGEYSFKTFSYQKAYTKKTTRIDLKFSYPPYRNKEKIIRRILR